jgi:hypothetical protein
VLNRPDVVRRLAVLGAAVTLLAGCTGESSSPSAGAPPPSAGAPATSAAVPSGDVSPAPAPDHVMVVVFENEDAEDVLGSGEAPYLDSLAEQGVSFTDAHAETHPSQPNYLALFSGSTQGITDDSCPNTIDEPNLAGQLRDAGLSFAGYSEGLPAVGSTECDSGDYARKHVPWANFPDLPPEVNQPFNALPADLADLPTVSFVIPDLCNDMHDCGIRAGDDWARGHLVDYVAWAQDHDSLLVVTFDEDDGTDDNHIATLMVGPMVTPGTSDQRIDHYSLLRTIEDMYGLSPLGHAAEATPVTGVWTQP